MRDSTVDSLPLKLGEVRCHDEVLQQLICAEPVDIVCAGGTSLVGGFIEVFRDEFAKINFPIPIREVRRAEEALNSVAKGCLVAAAIGE